MKLPYERPWPATAFYALAAITFLGSAASALVFMPRNVNLGASFGTDANQIMYASSVANLLLGAVAAAFFAALGGTVEIIAKIEWNTRTADEEVLTYNPGRNDLK